MSAGAPIDRLFLDTERAEVLGSELDSLALIGEDGAHCFYAERARVGDAHRLRAPCGLSAAGKRRCGDVQPGHDDRLTCVPGRLRCAYVLADYPNDLQLLQYVLAGFDLSDEQAQACVAIPRL